MEEKNKPNREREQRISLCFTEDEKKKVKAYADKERLQPGVLIRKMVLDKAEEELKETIIR